MLLSGVGTSFWSESRSVCSFVCLDRAGSVPSVPYKGPVMRESHGTDRASGVNGCDGSSRVVQWSIGFVEIFKLSKVLV